MPVIDTQPLCGFVYNITILWMEWNSKIYESISTKCFFFLIQKHRPTTSPINFIYRRRQQQARKSLLR